MSDNPAPKTTHDPVLTDSSHAERYRALAESIDEGFCVVEILLDEQGSPSDYVFLETNPAFERQSGLVDAQGKRMRELAPEHEEHWFQRYGSVALTGEPARFIHEARALGERWFDVYAYRVDRPELRHVAILFRDISARTVSERNTRLLSEVSDELLRIRREDDLASAVGPKIERHFHVSQCAFAEFDAQRQHVLIRHAWHRPEVPSVAGRHAIADFLVDDFWREAQSGRIVVVRDVRHDARVVRPERFEQLAIGSFVAIPLRREGEWHSLFVMYWRESSDWTDDQLEIARELAVRCWARLEHLRVEHAVRISEERLRLIVENARDYAIFAANLDRRITSWNFGAERLLGFTEEEMIGNSADIIFTPEDIAHGAPEREASTALREGRAVNERWHVRKDGERIWGSGMMMAMRDNRGVVYGLLKIMRDQTEEQRTRQALEASRKDLMDALQATEQARAESVAAGRAKDQFLAALSHELRTPLSPVLMLATEAAANPELPPQVRTDFDVIRKNIELEARLIDDLLDLTRIPQGKLPLKLVDVDVHERIESAIEMLLALANTKGVTVRKHLAARRTHILADPRRLQQILINLLNNAVKFTPSGGAVKIETSNPPDTPEILVRFTDTGIGMTPEEIAHVFEPFTQGSHAGASGSPVYGGLGLGLTIVDELTAKHGGRVEAASPGRGHGSTFTLRLPLTSGSESSPLLPPTRPLALPPTPPRRVLLVEDHAHTRNVVQRMLQRRGHTVVAAGSRAEALEAAQHESFDLVISDIGLPDGDGYELLQQLRVLQPRLQGIALSGFGMEGDLRRSSAAGFSVHLVKPVSVSKLDGIIASLPVS